MVEGYDPAGISEEIGNRRCASPDEGKDSAPHSEFANPAVPVLVCRNPLYMYGLEQLITVWVFPSVELIERGTVEPAAISVGLLEGAGYLNDPMELGQP